MNATSGTFKYTSAFATLAAALPVAGNSVPVPQAARSVAPAAQPRSAQRSGVRRDRGTPGTSATRKARRVNQLATGHITES